MTELSQYAQWWVAAGVFGPVLDLLDDLQRTCGEVRPTPPGERGSRAPGITLAGAGDTAPARTAWQPYSHGRKIHVIRAPRPTKQSTTRTAKLGETAEGKSFFLNIKGPELLNKYVGETERHIRLVFQRAREKASEGMPVIVFFDEMDSSFRTRGSGVSSNVENTIVPQLLSEIDGVEGLENVIVCRRADRRGGGSSARGQVTTGPRIGRV